MLTFAVDLRTARNIALRVSWIDGASNIVADPISRANFSAFRAAAPHANALATICGVSPFLAML